MKNNLIIPTQKDYSIISQIHPVIQHKVKYILVRAHQQGLPVYLFEGLRTFYKSHQYFMQGRNEKGEIVDRTKVITYADAGYSWHNYGLAVDIVFKINGRWSWSFKLPWQDLGLIGKEVGMFWGGDFRNFKDYPHFQFTCGMPIKNALKKYKEGGLNLVWKSVSSKAKLLGEDD